MAKLTGEAADLKTRLEAKIEQLLEASDFSFLEPSAFRLQLPRKGSGKVSLERISRGGF